MDFDAFFRQAYGKLDNQGFRCFEYQHRLATQAWPDLLDIPTGMGKTAAVTLAWLWKRGWCEADRSETPHADTPRRLIWCLPMRVLVEQTEENIRHWLNNLGILGEAGEGKVSVHVLMGGAGDLKSWAEHPEEDMILIGTQDMLLSRSLMRGYGMSRYQWPIHFALLHNDCLWALDEIQLMGAGLATSAQMEAFRRSFPLAKNSRTLWISATLRRDWLDTVDMHPHLDALVAHTINEADQRQASGRLKAAKTLQRAPVCLTKDNIKQKAKTYLEALAKHVLDQHDAQSQTLVIVNRVERAQQLFRLLRKQRPGQPDLLIHARFRAKERREQARQLRQKSVADRIIVATQAIEAGVDISSQTLVTELAPWASMVQRFGRCNRYGEYNTAGTQIHWIDIQDDADSLPYTVESLAASRDKLADLVNASPQDLPAVDQARPLTAVLRRKDLLELFNTDPDLSGFDVDISDYIRDSGTPGVQVFWRAFKDDPNTSADGDQPEGKPGREELCPISLGQAEGIHKRGAWYWDTLGNSTRNGQWVKLTRNPRPGMMLLLRASDGGYDEAVGFDAKANKPLDVSGHNEGLEPAFESDDLTQIGKWVTLPKHLADAASNATTLCERLAIDDRSGVPVIRAARWHDLGKAHEAFQSALHKVSTPPDLNTLWAKSNKYGRLVYQMGQHDGSPKRKYFRHELASMLAWLAQHDGETNADLIAYLIVAHHGKVRMSLRAMPGEEASPDIKRFARGVHEGDPLPALDFDGEHSDALRLKLGLMELGEGEQGASWTERTLKLLDDHGPFRLAWLETLVRLADWRASAAEQLELPSGEPQNESHELDQGHRKLAQPAADRATAATTGESAVQSGAQHGLRGRTSRSGDAGSRTRPPHAATRYLDTTLGTLSYAELAPHLARHVEAVQNSIREGQWDARPLDEALFLELHRHICADLTPNFAGHWRRQEVVVGHHQPPLPHLVAQAMREYVLDLNARMQALPAEPDERLLETLAFAEGRLLSVHPFTDFNGRTTRVFIDWLTRRLDLPDINPTPDEGPATERYLEALRAGDAKNWQPLMTIWRERFEQGGNP